MSLLCYVDWWCIASQDRHNTLLSSQRTHLTSSFSAPIILVVPANNFHLILPFTQPLLTLFSSVGKMNEKCIYSLFFFPADDGETLEEKCRCFEIIGRWQMLRHVLKRWIAFFFFFLLNGCSCSIFFLPRHGTAVQSVSNFKKKRNFVVSLAASLESGSTCCAFQKRTNISSQTSVAASGEGDLIWGKSAGSAKSGNNSSSR